MGGGGKLKDHTKKPNTPYWRGFKSRIQGRLYAILGDKKLLKFWQKMNLQSEDLPHLIAVQKKEQNYLSSAGQQSAAHQKKLKSETRLIGFKIKHILILNDLMAHQIRENSTNVRPQPPVAAMRGAPKDDEALPGPIATATPTAAAALHPGAP